MGTNAIREPPQIPKEKGIQVDDLYVHHSKQSFRAWRCTAVEPSVVWKDLPDLTTEIGKDGVRRQFVITSTGLPGWVSEHTVTRKYKDRTGNDVFSADEKGKQKETEEKEEAPREKRNAKEKAESKERRREKEGELSRAKSKTKSKSKSKSKERGGA